MTIMGTTRPLGNNVCEESCEIDFKKILLAVHQQSGWLDIKTEKTSQDNFAMFNVLQVIIIRICKAQMPMP